MFVYPFCLWKKKLRNIEHTDYFQGTQQFTDVPERIVKAEHGPLDDHVIYIEYSTTLIAHNVVSLPCLFQ